MSIALKPKELQPKGLSKLRPKQWLLGILSLIPITGMGYLAYHQFVVVPQQQAKAKVQTALVQRGNLSITVSTNGTVQPKVLVNVSPKTAGVLKQLLVKEGDSVQQGQVLAYMDDSNLQGQFNQAQGNLAAAKVTLQLAIVGNRPQDIAQAAAQLANDKAALKSAESTFQQNQQLYSNGALAQRDLITSRAARDQAAAQVRKSQQALDEEQVGSRPETIEQDRALVAAAQGAVQMIQQSLNDTVIHSPFSGIVTRKFADPGSFVTPTTAGSAVTSATSSSILSLASVNQIVAQVAEANIAQIHMALAATIQADAYPGKTFTGQVTEILTQADVVQNVTTFEVKTSVSDPQRLLRAGMNVNVVFHTGTLNNVLIVPTAAIVQQAKAQGVFVARDKGDPVFVPITVGTTVNDKTEVMSGVTENEAVLLSFPPGTRQVLVVPPCCQGQARARAHIRESFLLMKLAKPLSTAQARQPRKRRVSLGEVLVMSAQTLWSNKLRTVLTMLGVIIGIASVITITAVGQGVQQSTEQQLQALGTNVMLVSAGAARTGGISQGAGSASTLTWEESQAIAKEVPAAKAVSAFLQKGQIQIVRGNNNAATTLLGTDLNYPAVKNIQPQLGLFFSQGDLDAARPVAFLGAKVRDELFNPDEAVIGADLRIRGNRYTVVGVAAAKGTAGGQDLDDVIYIPLTNMSAQIVGNNALTGVAINGFWLEASDADQLNSAQFQVTNLLRLLHRIHPPAVDDFRITNQVDIINTFTNVVGSFTLMVSAIAGISLVVGGIGIANIMLVSVMERTREIGIRKAVGATSSAILSQFLTEAIVISMIGGVIGVGLGIGLAFVAATLFKFPFVVPLWSIGTGFGLSFLVGVLAGGIPARNAAKLDPITALHSE